MEKNIICFLTGFVCGVFLMLFTFPSQKKEGQLKYVKKTVKYAVHDTITIKQPMYSERRLCDTIWIDKERPYVVSEQRKYSDSLYTAWVSGVNPILDSIQIYNKTEYVEKTTEIYKTIEKKHKGWYVGVGVENIAHDFVPKLHAMYQYDRIAIGCGLGLYEKTPVYDLNIKYKLK